MCDVRDLDIRARIEGTRVILFGLGRDELNGHRAMILAVNEATGRLVVQVDCLTHRIQVKPENTIVDTFDASPDEAVLSVTPPFTCDTLFRCTHTGARAPD